MPTYLVHAFRWPRPLIRIHIILNNIDDAAAEWLMAPATTRALKEDFQAQSASIMQHLPDLRFIEQYDPDDESADAKSQPFAYVCDSVQEIKLGIDIDEVRGKGVSNESWSAMQDLRDKLAPGEKVAWFVVVCGDTERSFPSTVHVLESSGGMYSSSSYLEGATSESEATVPSRHESGHSPVDEKKKSRLAKLFSSRSISERSIRRQKSTKSLNSNTSSKHNLPSIDIPPIPQNQDSSSHSVYSPPPTGNTAAVPTHTHSSTSNSNSNSNITSRMPPRAGILPSPPASALPSPAYSAHPSVSIPPVSSTLPPSSNRPGTAQQAAAVQDSQGFTKDLPLRPASTGRTQEAVEQTIS